MKITDLTRRQDLFEGGTSLYPSSALRAWLSQNALAGGAAQAEDPAGAEADLAVVGDILRQVRRQGDVALRAFSSRFDGFDAESFRVPERAFLEAEAAVSESLKAVISEAKANIEAYHRHQQRADWSFSPRPGVLLGQRMRPIRRVALYIPGGKAAYPSTVLMNAIPALIAGVPEIALFTPPDPKGQINALVLYAAKLLGIQEVYRLGGAQAVAAAAYGTETIPRADKIVGPGNRFVALAKQLVFGTVAIDMIAGPSEVLILADASARADWIAADLLAQAEHDEDAALYLLTTSEALLPKIAAALEEQLLTLPKAGIARQAVSRNLQAFLLQDLDQAMALANAIAPEHLELQVAVPEALLPLVDQAGSVFLGAYAPEALGDYYAGPNHTLPTSGTARFSSPLGVYDFIKRPSFISYDQAAFESAGPAVAAFAAAEGLDAHCRSVTLRLKGGPNET